MDRAFNVSAGECPGRRILIPHDGAEVTTLLQTRVVHGSILCDPIQPNHQTTDPTQYN